MGSAVTVTWSGVGEADAAFGAIVARVTAITPDVLGGLIVEAVKAKVRPLHEVSGDLAGSIVGKLGEAAGGQFDVTLGPTAPYTRVIEMGHRGPQNKPPHPWFIPGVLGMTPKFNETLASAWRKAVSG